MYSVGTLFHPSNLYVCVHICEACVDVCWSLLLSPTLCVCVYEILRSCLLKLYFIYPLVMCIHVYMCICVCMYIYMYCEMNEACLLELRSSPPICECECVCHCLCVFVHLCVYVVCMYVFICGIQKL